MLLVVMNEGLSVPVLFKENKKKRHRGNEKESKVKV